MVKKVTVVVTVKNSVHTIKKCVDSILKNKGSFDVLIIDAFSNDGTYEILKTFEKKKKIKLVQVEGNAPRAFNYAIKNVKTEIIALTDADCVVENDWVEKLVNGIKGEFVASAGLCKSPSGLTGLSKIIGEEFDNRFDVNVDEVWRAPTMNLAFKTKVAKKILFDESLDVAFETDFGFKLLKYGKIKYIRDAVVYHYHRSTWKQFWKQQWNYGKFGMWVYLKHPKRVKGDHVSKGHFFKEVLWFYLGMGALMSSFWIKEIMLITVASLIGISVLFLKDFKTVNPSNKFTFLKLQSLRLVAWSVGGVLGTLQFLSTLIKNK